MGGPLTVDGQGFTNGQLVTTSLVGRLLKGEVLGSRNAKRTNNLLVRA